MSAVFKVKNIIREFCRKQDEIISPLFRFVFSLVLFMSLQKMFGYSELGSKSEVTVLLSVLTALLPDAFMFFMVGALVALHSFTVSIETGAVFVVLFIFMYCIYMRFFPNYTYAILIVPVFYLLNIPFAAPIIIGLVAGISGIIPAAFGVILVYYSYSVKELAALIKQDSFENMLESFKHLITSLITNKEMFSTILIFVITVTVLGVIAKFTFPYSVYIAIGAGTVVNILGAVLAGYVVGKDVAVSTVIAGSVVGLLIALVVRFGQGILDYKHTERVQFEDDDYYYYVKAVPKIDSEKKNKPENGNKKETDSQNADSQNMGSQKKGNQNMNPQNMGNQNMNSQNMGNQNMNPQNMGNQNVNPQRAQSQNMHPQHAQSHNMDLQSMGFQDVSASGMGNQNRNSQNKGSLNMKPQNNMPAGGMFYGNNEGMDDRIGGK